jgi:hypothetical protein
MKFACYGLFGFGSCVTYGGSIKEQVKETHVDNLNIFCSFGDFYDISVVFCHKVINEPFVSNNSM